MRFLHDIPIKRKLNLIAMFATGAALAVACAGIALYDQARGRGELVRNLASTAELIGLNSASALSFNDPKSAEETLQSLRAQPNVVAACVYDRTGNVFATYRRAELSGFVPVSRVTAERTQFVGDGLEVVRGI